MIDSWKYDPALDGDAATSDTRGKVKEAVAQGMSVYVIGDPRDSSILAVVACDPAGGHPLVLSDERDAGL